MAEPLEKPVIYFHLACCHQLLGTPEDIEKANFYFNKIGVLDIPFACHFYAKIKLRSQLGKGELSIAFLKDIQEKLRRSIAGGITQDIVLYCQVTLKIEPTEHKSIILLLTQYLATKPDPKAQEILDLLKENSETSKEVTEIATTVTTANAAAHVPITSLATVLETASAAATAYATKTVPAIATTFAAKALTATTSSKDSKI